MVPETAEPVPNVSSTYARLDPCNWKLSSGIYPYIPQELAYMPLSVRRAVALLPTTVHGAAPSGDRWMAFRVLEPVASEIVPPAAADQLIRTPYRVYAWPVPPPSRRSPLMAPPIGASNHDAVWP